MSYIEHDFPVEKLNRVALAEGNSKKPVYAMHKWWARRLGSVFRMIILAAFSEDGEPAESVWGKFCQGHNLQGKLILDPFMGGGTTLVEALRLGARVIGVDINLATSESMYERSYGLPRYRPSHLQRSMVEAGEVDALVPERVWQEIARGLMEAHPARMFAVLRDCGALARQLPELDRLWGVPQRADYHPEVDTGVHTMMVIETAAAMGAPLPVRFAALVHDLGKGTTPDDILPCHVGHEERSVPMIDAVCQRLRVPTDCRDLALVVAREHGNIHRSDGFDATALVRLLERCDALRKPERFRQALLACEADARGRLGFEDRAYPQTERLLRARRCPSAPAQSPSATPTTRPTSSRPCMWRASRPSRRPASDTLAR